MFSDYCITKKGKDFQSQISEIEKNTIICEFALFELAQRKMISEKESFYHLSPTASSSLMKIFFIFRSLRTPKNQLSDCTNVAS
jgi:hypothetical protein